MSHQTYQFASESVCAGHPDKLCDQISDAILDAALRQDTSARVAVEALASADKLILAGEITTGAMLDVESIAREQIRRLGYSRPEWGFHDGCEVVNLLHHQSEEISIGVNDDGAGDQGMMFGFACDDTAELMPLPITLAHAITRRIDEARESGQLPYLRPDGKAQAVVRYENGRPVGVEHVTVAVPHDETVELRRVKRDVHEQIIAPVLDEYNFSVPMRKFVLNGTGVWYTPGPFSDAGLTGRKIVVDGYGGFGRVGGGAFSGKDPSKVDRSGAYAARYIAKNIVAHKLASKCEVMLAYHIGAKKPVMVNVETFGSSTVSAGELDKFAKKLLVPSVKNIVDTLDLRRPIYLPTAAYGHFGRPEFPWEAIIKP